jgi:pyrroline-5-carboxylate reductase
MSRRICVLGAGKAGEALVAGLLSSGWAKPADIVATARHEERIDELSKRYGIEGTLDNVAAVKGAQVVVIAVKPQDIEALLGDVGAALDSSQTVLSIAAAIPTELIERHVGDGVPVVRAMPNAPVTVHEGMAGVTGGAHATEEHVALAEEVLGSVGRSVRVDEAYMDAVTAVSG